MQIAKRPKTKTSNADVPDLVRRRLAELRTLRDEIRVRLNLAGKEARERWRGLETRVRSAEAAVRRARSQRVRTLAKLVTEVKQFRNRLLEKAAPISRIC